MAIEPPAVRRLSELEPFTEGVIEIVERAEEIVVEKRSRVVEEIVVDKEVTSREATVRARVRRTEVHVERID